MRIRRSQFEVTISTVSFVQLFWFPLLIIILILATAPCDTANCDSQATCEVKDNKAKCICPSEADCPWKVDLICGSDGQSYLNECVMKTKACKAGKKVTRKRRGYCGE